ncbi:MAG: pyrimidine-nucleoside phosphorylase [Bacilli bacterium]
MRMVEIIEKKRLGQALTSAEIDFFIEGYTKGRIPDYQASALLMAIVFQGMNTAEIVALTKAMMYSGEIVDLSEIAGIKVDKHSTGGVGDKTSLVIGPLVASLGAKLAKMSGRGLGHTGGTLDKLESIPGLSIDIEIPRFTKQVNEIGLAIIGQTGQLVPADKKLYALRDVTATVQSMPLISSSIMSKKLASGSDTILLDVKFGSGAFMKTIAEARTLAQTMVAIGRGLNRDTRAMLTDMDQPLGRAVGNILEVKEAIATLNGGGPADFRELCLTAVAIMLVQAKLVPSLEEGKKRAEANLQNGKALAKFKAMVQAQGGQVEYIDHPERFAQAQHLVPVLAQDRGYVVHIDSYAIGVAGMELGAGRATKDDAIDYTAGIIIGKKVGDRVEIGEVLAELHTNLEQSKIAAVVSKVRNAYTLEKKKPALKPVVYEIIAG